MKRIILFAAILTALTSVSQAQTALYKKYSNIKGLNAYCVERFPLGDNDSVTLTYFVAEFIKTELQKSPKPAISSEFTVTQEKRASVPEPPKNSKAVTIYTRKSLPGDKGEYLLFLPSDRMSILVFHIQKPGDRFAVISYMIDSEFNNK